MFKVTYVDRDLTKEECVRLFKKMPVYLRDEYDDFYSDIALHGMDLPYDKCKHCLDESTFNEIYVSHFTGYDADITTCEDFADLLTNILFYNKGKKIYEVVSSKMQFIETNTSEVKKIITTLTNIITIRNCMPIEPTHEQKPCTHMGKKGKNLKT